MTSIVNSSGVNNFFSSPTLMAMLPAPPARRAVHAWFRSEK
jgi:hypothetical protein